MGVKQKYHIILISLFLIFISCEKEKLGTRQIDNKYWVISSISVNDLDKPLTSFESLLTYRFDKCPTTEYSCSGYFEVIGVSTKLFHWNFEIDENTEEEKIHIYNDIQELRILPETTYESDFERRVINYHNSEDNHTYEVVKRNAFFMTWKYSDSLHNTYIIKLRSKRFN